MKHNQGICPYCGHVIIDDNQEYCDYCGMDIVILLIILLVSRK